MKSNTYKWIFLAAVLRIYRVLEAIFKSYHAFNITNPGTLLAPFHPPLVGDWTCILINRIDGFFFWPFFLITFKPPPPLPPSLPFFLADQCKRTNCFSAFSHLSPNLLLDAADWWWRLVKWSESVPTFPSPPPFPPSVLLYIYPFFCSSPDYWSEKCISVEEREGSNSLSTSLVLSLLSTSFPQLPPSPFSVHLHPPLLTSTVPPKSPPPYLPFPSRICICE